MEKRGGRVWGLWGEGSPPQAAPLPIAAERAARRSSLAARRSALSAIAADAPPTRGTKSAAATVTSCRVHRAPGSSGRLQPRGSRCSSLHRAAGGCPCSRHLQAASTACAVEERGRTALHPGRQRPRRTAETTRQAQRKGSALPLALYTRAAAPSPHRACARACLRIRSPRQIARGSCRCSRPAAHRCAPVSRETSEHTSTRLSHMSATEGRAAYAYRPAVAQQVGGADRELAEEGGEAGALRRGRDAHDLATARRLQPREQRRRARRRARRRRCGRRGEGVDTREAAALAALGAVPLRTQARDADGRSSGASAGPLRRTLNIALPWVSFSFGPRSSDRGGGVPRGCHVQSA